MSRSGMARRLAIRRAPDGEFAARFRGQSPGAANLGFSRTCRCPGAREWRVCPAPAFCRAVARVDPRLVAAEFGPQQVRVNAILPGAVDTAMYRGMNDSADKQAYITNLHALKRVAAPEEIARSVLYLASDDASFVTGTASLLDGGISITRS